MHKQIYFWTALFWSGIILFACMLTSDDVPKIKIENLDKIVHCFFYFVHTALWFLYIKKQLNSGNYYKSLSISFLFSFFFGIGIELIQNYFTTTRTADALDVLANTAGATLAVIFIILLNKYSRIVAKI